MEDRIPASCEDAAPALGAQRRGDAFHACSTAGEASVADVAAL